MCRRETGVVFHSPPTTTAYETSTFTDKEGRMDTHPCVICAIPLPRNALLVRGHITVPKSINKRCQSPFHCPPKANFRRGQNTRDFAKSIEWKILRIQVLLHPSCNNVLGTYCGLCGKQGPVVQTECCGHFLCEPPENEYDTKLPILDNCSRNHDKYTLCGLHKEHSGENCNWRDCSKCKTKFPKVEMYVGYGTKNYNFDCENWNAPKFEVTHCAECGILIHLNTTMHIVRQNQTVICHKHQEIPASMLKSLLASGKYKVESFGMS
jgi:hypothetical protein